jgi:phosphoribosylformimino-5-aminoimidazole carboxamide ribotide isomerase
MSAFANMQSPTDERFPGVIPVIDVRRGIVVRGIAGERDAYQPLDSRLTDSVDPVRVAEALIAAYRPATMYLADLDAIMDDRVNLELYRVLGTLPVTWLIDAGVREVTRLRLLTALSEVRVVCGLESLTSPAVLREFLTAVDPARLVFSLDLKQGVPLATAAWPSEPAAIARLAWSSGLREQIVLDLSDVGMSTGGSRDALCRELLSWEGLRLITGGGVRGPADVTRLRNLGVTGVLVASALHDGRLVGPGDLSERRGVSPP